MADQRIQATENMIGANHPSLTDTLNRLTEVEHNTDGTHKVITGSPAATLGATTTSSLSASGTALIGTTTDNGSGAKLQVKGNIATNTDVSSTITVVDGVGTTAGHGNELCVVGADATGPYINGTFYVTPVPLRFLTGNIEKARITDTGNFLVGTTTDNGSGAKLQVNGTITAANGIRWNSYTNPTLDNNYDVHIIYISNTSVRLELKGSDGVTRGITLTLS